MSIDRELARMDRNLEDIRRLIRERNEQTDRWRKECGSPAAESDGA